MLTVAVLAVLCVALFGPVPILLDRAHWPVRAPRVGVLVWQAIGLGGSLAAIGAGLGVAVTPLHGSVVSGFESLVTHALAGHPLANLGLYEALGLTMATDVAMVLVGGLVMTLVRTLRARRRHRTLLDLVAERSDRTPGALLLARPEVAAYCLPGLRPRIVLSAGTVGLLQPEELGAVLAHERGHVHARHDLVMLPFASMVSLLQWLPYVRRAPRAVALLLEMAADDFASRFHERRTVAAALVRIASSPSAGVPACAFAAAGSVVAVRVRRLVDPPVRPRRAGALGLIGAAGVLAAPSLVMLLPFGGVH